MSGVMENVFEFIDPFFLLTAGLFVLRFEINVIKTDQEELCSCFNSYLMHVLRRKQEKMTVAIFKLVFINAVGASTVYDVNQFKEVVPVGWFQYFVGFFINDLKGVMKVISAHTCKSTE